MRPPRVLVSAGEPSGDRLAAGVVRALYAAAPDVDVVSTAGPEAQAAGAATLADLASSAVVGFVEVLRHLPRLLRIRRAVEDLFRRRAVDLFLPVDYPGLHLRLAAAARRAGVPVLDYVAPQSWAWGAARTARMPDLCDGLAVVFDFEEDLFRRAGADARFVGHPVLDAPPVRPRAETRAALGVPDGAALAALLPGARAGEIGRHLPLLCGVAARLERRGVVPVLSRAPGATLEAAGLRVHDGPARDLLAAADVAVAKSGTTTIEAAVLGVPLVVVYKASTPTYAIARRLVRVPHVAMPNVLLGRQAVPEFVQDAATPEAVAAAAAALLDRPAPLRAALAEVRGRLGRPGAGARVAAWALDLLGRPDEADALRASAGPARAADGRAVA